MSFALKKLRSSLVPISIALLFAGCERSEPDHPQDELFAGFSQGQKILEDIRDLRTAELHARIDNQLEKWSDSKREMPYMDEMLLWGYLGLLEERPDVVWDRYWLDTNFVLQYLGERQLHSHLRRLPDCGLILAMSSVGLSTGGAARTCETQHTVVDLVDPLVLPAIDGDSSIRPIVIKMPPNMFLNRRPDGSDFGWTRTGSLPESYLRMYPARTGSQTSRTYDALVIDNGCPTCKGAAKWSRTKTFTIELRRCLDASSQGVSCTGSYSSEDVRTYSVTLPVNLGIHAESNFHGATLSWRSLRVGRRINEIVYGSGGDTAISGDMTWSTDPPTLPSGLGFGYSPLHTGQNFQFTGQVQEGASSFVGKVQLEQDGQVVTRDMEIEVPVHFLGRDQGGFAITLEQGEQNVNITLPQPRGGDGATYTWTASTSDSDTLSQELGLTLTADGKLHGDVPASVTISDPPTTPAVSVSVTVSSTIGNSTHPTMSFTIVEPAPPPPPLRFEAPAGNNPGGGPSGVRALTLDLDVGAAQPMWICTVDPPATRVFATLTPYPRPQLPQQPLVVRVDGDTATGISNPEWDATSGVDQRCVGITIHGLTPGSYAIIADAPGFHSAALPGQVLE